MLLLGIVFALSPLSVMAEVTEGQLVEVCKKDCPKAKTNDEAHKCAEKKGRLNKGFRKSQCWDINEKYEKQIGVSHSE